uniref:Uncharacterized protein n=1 Tax=Panagrolaimus davidi TaxID=227884 RepID=A0A914QPR8_9BILA
MIFKLAGYPLCEILQNGKPDAKTTRERGTKIVQGLRKIVNGFNVINQRRQNLYWNSDIIQNSTKDYIENEFINEKIADYVFDDLSEKYKYGDYNFFVSVDNDAGKHHYGTIVHCSTECKSVKRFMDKNVYILRNVKSDKGYHECSYLQSLQTESEAKILCTTFNSNSTLDIFGNVLIEKCKDIRGLSIVRDGYGYISKGDKSDNGFTEIYFKNKCFGNLHVVIANNPL